MSLLIGADVSSLQAMEDNGAIFYDEDGRQDDALNILKRHGVNSIRLRLFNDPEMSFDRGDYCNVKNTLPIAKRIKEKGLGLYLDFHYSDFWADWQKQNIPKAWKGKNVDELCNAIYDYTYDSLNQFKNNNAWPDMIQIGNEIGRGLLWNYGSLDNPDNITKFLNAGINAVQDASDEEHTTPKIMIHIECGAEKEQTEQYFKNLEKYGIKDFDYVGLSYYPYWAGPYEKFIENARNVYTIFKKKVIIAETAFPYTDVSNDNTPNVVTGELTIESMGMEPSCENQYEVLKKIIKIVQDEPSIEGVYYWEPVWYQIKGVGAEKGKGNEWENQAIFDHNGHALKAINVFAI
ncbi:MAG: glycosyl hydrolase [Pseudobutyrivibrio ruminis]|uniref:glycoside hydrolase family 53 protein n=1 Tax=Pseudobutyrivibrio ruminis TaxID=46206 RepID=UPI0026F31AB4|nr:glycosyl hydrolase 53 family protein [Pseudobutyrivibrio ruminis]MBE5913760.1 glycosyl hydrolase [Pseudobutyrivibrio ruminis]